MCIFKLIKGLNEAEDGYHHSKHINLSLAAIFPSSSLSFVYSYIPPLDQRDAQKSRTTPTNR